MAQSDILFLLFFITRQCSSLGVGSQGVVFWLADDTNGLLPCAFLSFVSFLDRTFESFSSVPFASYSGARIAQEIQ